MKHLTLVAGVVVWLALPCLAQPGGPVELHNPHRRGDRPMDNGAPMGGNGGGFPNMAPGGASFNGFGIGNGPGFYPAPQTVIVAPPAIAMLADGPYLFVMRGNSLFQFDKKAFRLLTSAELPTPTATSAIPQPALTPPGNGYYGGNPTASAIPPFATIAPPAVVMSTDGPLLFVMRGDSLFQLDKKTLKLLHATEIPAPVATTATAQDDVVTHTSPPLRPGPAFKNGSTF